MSQEKSYLDVPPAPKTDGFVEANGLKISYRSWTNPNANKTQNNPPFLLIHGLASALRIWDLVAPPLVQATDSQVVALDQRGHGVSDKPDTGYDNNQIVADDYKLATSLNLKKPLVVGHSWGATIALAYAATHPNEVSGLVLVDGGMGNMRDRPDATWENIRKNLAPPEFGGTPKEKFLDFYRQGPQGKYFGPIWNDQLTDIVLNIVQLSADDTVGPRLSRANHMKILRSMWETDNYQLAGQVTCPVLMVSAETSLQTGNAGASEWARMKREGAAKMKASFAKSPQVEFLVMPDTVHDIPLQRPAQLSAAIVRFGREAGILS